MKRFEFQALVKRAEAKARRKTEIKRLIKSAALANSRKDALKYGIKAACGALEKDASWASRLVGKGINRVARAGRAAGAAPNFGERFGSQLIDRGFSGAIGDAGRRIWGHGAADIAGKGSGIRGWWNDLTGKSLRDFKGHFEGPRHTVEEVWGSGKKLLSEARDPAALAKRDATYLRRAQELANNGTPLDDVQSVVNNAAGRQAARIAARQNKTRLITGAVAAPVAIGGGASMFGGGENPQETSYASRYTPRYGAYGYPQYGWG